ncbi:TPA: hypothetical protein ACIKQZ_001123, partial [Enterococcus faecalis]
QTNYLYVDITKMKNSIQKLPICFIDSSVPLLKNLFADSIMNTKKRLAQAKRFDSLFTSNL